MTAKREPPAMVPSAEERAKQVVYSSTGMDLFHPRQLEAIAPITTLISAVWRDGYNAALAAQQPPPHDLGGFTTETDAAESGSRDGTTSVLPRSALDPPMPAGAGTPRGESDDSRLYATPKPGDAERLTRLRSLIVNRFKIIDYEDPDQFLIRLLDAAKADITILRVDVSAAQSALGESQRYTKTLIEAVQTQSILITKQDDEIGKSRAEIARLTETIRHDIEQCARIARDKALQQIELYEARAELARRRSPTATGNDEENAGRILFGATARKKNPAAMQTRVANTLAVARAQGEREERERNAEIRHAAIAFLAITETSNLTEAITRDKIAWGLRHNLRRALDPEPQPDSAQADDASGEGGGE
jgi:hypothetical protein